MEIPGIPGKSLKSWLRRYGALRYLFAVSLGCLAALLQFGVQWLTGSRRDASAYEFFLGATALSAVWGGRSSSVVTLTCSALFKLYFFLPPFNSFRVDSPATFIHFFLFLSIGFLICMVGGALNASQEVLGSTLNSIGDAVVATNDRKLISFMNPVAESLTGWKAEEAVGRPVGEVVRFIDERTLAPVELPVDATLKRGITGHLPGRRLLVSRTGQSVPIQDSISPILGAPRPACGAIMIFHDVTEQRQAENALRDSEQRYRFLAESVPEFIFTADSRGECDYWNQRWYNYTGLTIEQSMGQNWMTALYAEDLPTLRTRWLASVQNGKAFEAECRLRDREARYHWFLVRGFPMRDDDDNVVRWFGTCTNVEDFKNTQEQLYQALKMDAVGRLAGGVAHDFNNLLTVIVGYGQILSDSAEPGSVPARQVQQILYAAERASELTRQLLTFSRRQIVQPRVLDLNSILRESETMVRRLIGEHIVVRTILDPELLPVRIDRSQIEQVIVNLAVNARDAMPSGGYLSFETSNVHLDDAKMNVEPGRYVLLIVSDTGQGMDQETQAHIFEPFFTTKGPEKGTGLGLSTVYGIIKQSGGHIRTYSEPGQGTTFKIYLPAVLEGGGEEQQPAPPSLAETHGTETILVVEDEVTVRKLVTAILARQGYTILEADTPEEALRQCREYPEPIHLLLTDVIMPGMNGIQVAQQALEYRPTLRVLYMSGHTEVAIAHHGILDSGAPFIQKPFSSESLSEKVRDILDA